MMLNKKTQQIIFWSVIIVLIILYFLYPKINEKYMSRKKVREYRLEKKKQVKEDALKAGKKVLEIKNSKCMKTDKAGERLGKELFNNYRKIYKKIHMFNEMMIVEVKNMSYMLARINKLCSDKDPNMAEKINTLKTELNKLIQSVNVSELEVVSEIAPDDEGDITILPIEPDVKPKPPPNQIQPREQTQTDTLTAGGDVAVVDGDVAVADDAGEQEPEGMLI